MANVVQASAKKLFLDGDIDLLTDTIKVYLIDTADYTYSASHAFLSDIPSAARVANSTLASKTTTGGVFDAADTSFASVSGDVSEALAIVKDTGVEGTSPFIAYIDTGVGGLPVTPSGTNILVTWNASGIIALQLMPITDPSDIAGLGLWLRADSLALSDNDPVTTWVDESVNAISFIAAGALRPTYKTSIQNSLPVVRFDGSQRLQSAIDFYFYDALVSPDGDKTTVFIVQMQAGVDNENSTFGWNTVGMTEVQRAACHVTFANVIYWDCGANQTSGRMSAPQPVGWDDEFHVVELYRNVNAGEIVVDGAVLASAGFTGAPLNLNEVRPMTIGVLQDAFLTGDIAEIVIYKRALNSTERGDVYDYLYDKWFVEPVLELTPPVVANPFQVFAPMVTVAGAPPILYPPLVSNPFQVFAPTVSVAAFAPSVGTSSFQHGFVDEASNLLIAANNASASLSSAIDAADIPPFTITLAGNLDKFSTSGAVTIDVREPTSGNSNEIFYFDGRTGDELNVTARAQDGTTAKSFAIGAQAQMRNIARHHNLLAETIIDIEEAVFDHTHDVADVSGLQSALDSKADQSALDSKADQSAVDTRVAKTGDTMSGLLTLSGAPTANLHAATKRYVDDVSFGYFNAKLHGLAGNGTTDDTVALQSLIDTVYAAGGGTIYLPPGIYLIGGPLQDPSGRNGQILVPLTPESTPPRTIHLVGAIEPPSQFWAGSDLLTSLNTYSIIKSTLTGASGSASLISGAADAVPIFGSYSYNNTRFCVKNLIFQVPPNPTFTCLNFDRSVSNSIEGILIHTGSMSIGGVAEPTHTNACGVRLPADATGNHTYVHRLAVFGFYTGFTIGELTHISFAESWMCKRAFEFPNAGYASTIHLLLSVWCQRGLVATGTGDKKTQIGMYVIENSGASGPAWMATVYDVDDPSNLMVGTLTWQTGTSGIGMTHTFLKNGGTRFLTHEIGTSI